MKKLAHQLRCLSTLLIMAPLFCANAEEIQESKSLEEFMQQISSINAASLLGGKIEEAPATVVSLTAQDIEKSTAENMSEVMQKLVPGAYVIDHLWVNPMWGLRGIMTDRPENVLLNVNGEMQNLVSRNGITGESVLGLMDDIKEVQVIVGPGSVIYGQGALAGVTNLELKDGRGEAKRQLHISYGSHKDVSSQYAHVLNFGNDRILRLSAGYRVHNVKSDGYRGMKPGYNDWEYGNPNFIHNSYDQGPMYRATAVYTNKLLKQRAWFRYYDVTFTPNYLSDTPSTTSTPPGVLQSRQYYHKNLSISMDQTFDLNKNFDFKVTLGTTFANYGIERNRNGTTYGRNPELSFKGDTIEAIPESRYRLRADLTFKNEDHPFVLATEYRHDDFGKNFMGPYGIMPEEYPNNQLGQKPIKDTAYNNIAVISEYQYRGQKQIVTPILGARYDKHSYSETLAPRAALVKSWGSGHSTRAVYQVAYKALSTDNLEGGVETTSQYIPDKKALTPARNKSYEIGHHYTSEHFDFSLVGYTNDLKIYTWNGVEFKQEQNTLSTYGFELGTKVKWDKWHSNLSHSLVRLNGRPSRDSGFTADNKHLKNFMEDITRAGFGVDWTEKLSFELTAQYWWPFKGRDAIVDYKRRVYPNAVKDVDYLNSDNLKLDFQTSYILSEGRLIFDIRNIGGFLNDKYKGINTYDSKPVNNPADYGGVYNESLVFLTDTPHVKLTYAYNF